MPDVSYPSIPDPNIDPGAMLNTLNRLKETVELMTGQRQDKRFSFPSQVQAVERRSATSSARFSEELRVQANSIEAVVVRTTTLEAQMGVANAAITTEQTVRATADIALASDITTLTATVGSVNAQLISESTTRATADTALASSITTVTATANGATASGQVYLIAESAPSGYTAQFGWTLQATSQPFGMKALVDGSGVGSIAFIANRFKLIDPSYLGGDPVNVFNYNGTTFNFDVPVTIRNQEIGTNAVTNTVITTGNIASGGIIVAPILTARAGARLRIEVKITDTSASIYLAPFSTTFTSRSCDVQWNNGAGGGNTLVGYLTTMDTVITSNFLGGSSYVFYKAITPASQVLVLSGVAAGNYQFFMTNTTPYTLGMTLEVTELADS